MGFKEINWNLGCPFKRVAAKKRGSGLLPHPELVKQILEIAMAEIPIKLSVKCRLGYDSPTEIFDLLPIFQNYGISELIIHARLGKQIYKGEVDIQTFDQVCEMSHLHIVYNGDIFSQDDFQKYNSQFENIENWMIGRGLLVDPFLSSLSVKLLFSKGSGAGSLNLTTRCLVAKSSPHAVHTIFSFFLKILRANDCFFAIGV